MRKILILLWCVSLIIASNGCVAINSLGVKGFPIRSGLYAGLSEQYVRAQNDDQDYTPVFELGYTDIRTADLAHRFYRIHGAVADQDGFRRRAGLEGGYEFLSMGADWDLGEFYRSRFFFGGVLGTIPAHATFSFYHGATSIHQEFDLHYTFLPKEDKFPVEPVETDWFFTLGQRLIWYEGTQGAALFGSVARVIEPRQEGEWRKYNVADTWLVELSGMVDNSGWFQRDEFEVQARLAFALKYFF